MLDKTLKEWEEGGNGTGGVDIVSTPSLEPTDTFDFMTPRFVLRLRSAWVSIRAMFGAQTVTCDDDIGLMC
jgi:hypothetical protein